MLNLQHIIFLPPHKLCINQMFNLTKPNQKMKKMKIILGLLVLIFAVSCNQNDELVNTDSQNESQQKLLSIDEVNNQITNAIHKNGTFDWKEASDQLLWSAVMHGGNIVTVGYGDENESFRTEKSDRLTAVKNDILTSIKSSSAEKATKDVLLFEDNTLNLIDVKVLDISTIKMLREKSNIRYIEPEGYEYSGEILAQDKSAAGCDKSSNSISWSDYGHVGNAHFPWNFYDHKINQAWAYSKGRGIGVGVIDTGVSNSQKNLGYRFDDYYSGRYIRKYGTYVDSWRWWATNTDGYHDKCGHGTSTAATVGAPLNNNHKMVGVAYECNLVTYRGTSDVVLNGYHERKGVAKALKQLGNRSDVKIISMSIGYPWSIGRIKDAVRYAYARGKMIFAAGGTSTSYTNWYGVIFPATMSETVAVTGVEESSSYSECDVCHKGSKIDFTFVMERANNHHHPILGYYDGQSSYFGGSSVATAATAGIAALVWSRYPYWSRAQVYSRLRYAAAFSSKSSNFGYGNINALKAVRGY